MKKFTFLFFLPFILLAVSCNPQTQTEFSRIGGTVTIGEAVIAVELAQTLEERSKGLMRRTSLPDDQGMLFVFEDYGYHPFWMKDTFIPLDIIWIAGDEIVHIEREVPPGKGLIPPSYAPDAPANLVLEVNAGVSRENGWEVGDKVRLTLP